MVKKDQKVSKELGSITQGIKCKKYVYLKHLTNLHIDDGLDLCLVELGVVIYSHKKFYFSLSSERHL